jgi:hypothetical protein
LLGRGRGTLVLKYREVIPYKHGFILRIPLEFSFLSYNNRFRDNSGQISQVDTRVTTHLTK